MGFIVGWLIKKCVEAVADIYGMLNNLVANVFETDLINSVILVFQNLGLVLLAVAVIMRISIFGEQSANGKPDILSLGKDIFFGLIFVPLNIHLRFVFIKVTELQSLAVKSIASSISNPDLSLLLSPGDNILKQLFVVVFAVTAFALLWGTLKRSAMAVAYLLCNYFSVIGIATGNTSFFFSTMSKFAGMCVVHFLQGVFFFGAVASLISVSNEGLAVLKDISQLIHPLVYLVFSLTTPKIIEMAFSTGTGQRGGMAQTFSGVAQSMMILKAMK